MFDLVKKKLIHYTNYLTEECVNEYNRTRKIKVCGNSSARANYSMRWKQEKEKYVWFHQSDESGQEPILKSFFYTHITESKPRKYKIIIDPNKLSRQLLYIRPTDKCIVYLGDIYEQGYIEELFRWYNKKIYFRKSFLSITPLDFSLFIFTLVLQILGDMRDLYEEINKKIRKA